MPQATFTQEKTNGDAVQDLLRNDVEVTAINAPDKMESGGAADVNNVAQGTMAIWTTAVMKREEDLRYSMGLDYSQAAVQVWWDCYRGCGFGCSFPMAGDLWGHGL